MPKLRQPPKPQGSATPEPHENVEVPAEEELFETEPEIKAGEEEVVVTPKEEPKKDENALQKQLDALKQSEQAAKTQRDQALRDREEAQRRAAAREAEATKFQKEAHQSRADSISAAIAAATAEIAAAKKEIKDAISIGDIDAQTEAMAKLSEAQNALSSAKLGKSALEESAVVEPEPVKQQAVEDPLDKTNLPQTAKDWLRSHREYLTDPRKNAKIQALHWDVVDEGHEAFSPEYYVSLETHLGMRKVPGKEVEEEEIEITPKTQQRNSIVSAPVSREVPNGKVNQRSSKIDLTVAQREAAKSAGITEAEYAKQLQRMNEMKANGQIQN